MDGIEKYVKPTFSKNEKKNLALLVLCYAFLTSSLSLIVGTSSVEVKYLEKDTNTHSNNIAPLAYALFMIGTSFISLVTIPIFKCGRKVGFIIGNVFGIIGAILGAVAVQTQSIPLLLFSYIPLGAANGIGNYLRFAAIEVVPSEFEALAVTLVLSGGVISAFVGPEAAQDTKFIFAKEPFLNIFVMLASFNLIMGILVCFVDFPTPVSSETKENRDDETIPEEVKDNETSFKSIIMSRSFWIPAMIASFSWGIMTMPMSITRVAMEDAEYTARNSLTVIELHFLGMFLPGFISGKVIQRKGYVFTLIIALFAFILGLVLNLISRPKEIGTIATWILGLFLMGAGWNFGFASSTVWLTHSYDKNPNLKDKIQASNDFIMFAVTGIMIISTGYIYDPDGRTYVGNVLHGWQIVNYVTLGYVVVLACFVVFGYVSQKIESKKLEEKDVKEAVIDCGPSADENGELT